MPSPRKTQDLALKEIVNEEKYGFNKYRRTGTIIFQEINVAISQSQKFKVNKWVLAGSIGKRTWLGKSHEPDFDAVLLIQQPMTITPDAILIEIASIISKINSRYKLNYVSRHTVQFSYKTDDFGTLEFDVVPGLNWVTDTGTDPHQDYTQLDRTLKEIVKLGGVASTAYKSSPFLSASLAQFVKNFFSGEDDFVRDVIKLVKLWNRKMVGDKPFGNNKIPGRSFTMEIIGIYTARQEKAEVGGQRSLLGAFERAMVLISQPRKKVKVVFPFPQGASRTQAAVVQQYERLSSQYGVIMDPTNPFNNLLENFTDSQWEVFRNAAKSSIKIIQREDGSIVECFKSEEPSFCAIL